MHGFLNWIENFDYENDPNVPHLIQSKLDRMSGHKVVIVDVAKFDQAWSQDYGFYLPPGGRGSNYIPLYHKDNPDYNRYDRVQEEVPKFKESGRDFEMSTVGLKGNIPTFTDGRHRFAYFRDKGIKHLPISVSKANAIKMKKLFG
jgi:hypothetical protein